MTAARLDAESLPSGVPRERLLDDLAELERTIDHIITEARRPTRSQPRLVDLGLVVAQRTAFWQALADEQGRPTDVSIAATDPLWCPIEEAELEAAIDALIGNVFAHTNEGVQYAVSLDARDGEAYVVVADEGPGFPSTNVVARGQSGGGSTGLGLDIARRTAETVGGSLDTSSSIGGGARVTLRLPLAVV